MFNENVASAKCIVLSGSWSQGAIGDEYQCLIDVANQHKKASFVDCTGDQLINALRARPHTVHLNRSEFQDQFGSENPAKSLNMLLDQCEKVALTDGDKGLYLIEKNRTFHAISSVDLMHSAVGSGDCLMAGFAVAFSKSLDSSETAGLAASCGAANCLRHDLGMLFADDVKLLYKNTQVNVSQGHLNFV
jgi:fructose-1-phosphate kinase PfkB-like protein